MAAIARSRPRPLISSRPSVSKSRYQVIRMKEMLAAALPGRNGAGLFSVKPRGAEAGGGGEPQPPGSATFLREGSFASPVMSATPTMEAFGGGGERRASGTVAKQMSGMGSRHGSISSAIGVA